jgi:uncharacterized coiled-coil DUF342 family protein
MERLERIKSQYASENDVDWLIEQAEKVEELRKENWSLHQEIGGYAGRIEALIEEFDMLTGRMKLLKTQMFNPK